ncbi:methylated-DNA--[protein]-cysteine S-methyltransferase [Actinoallomurus spadix]|uniref:Methylated-DNA--protein-cysteine methyltransferase n=1 Tax=Actinoallomurus spadix TaxID=79912 RepID=A0ABN0WPQ7_9ACTN|nr:methylated-DNA--[protein]-cysteine S-methyltransferase [Actinoallomurus spadix]MCO5984827.1 methylated-DNA--[protein]-cysteine S-methyltransferase [Actinoallomurus spadix]
MSPRVHTVMDSPVGPLTLVAAGGALTGLYMDRQRYRPEQHTFGERDPAPFGAAIGQLEEYFAGRRTVFDLPLAPAGTAFQRRVWAALREIPFGGTVSYGELAERIGRPTAARAVGLANGKNPIGIILPCHRVVGSTGDLTGYGGGLHRKRHLLAFERRAGAAPMAPLPVPDAALDQRPNGQGR